MNSDQSSIRRAFNNQDTQSYMYFKDNQDKNEKLEWLKPFRNLSLSLSLSLSLVKNHRSPMLPSCLHTVL